MTILEQKNNEIDTMINDVNTWTQELVNIHQCTNDLLKDELHQRQTQMETQFKEIQEYLTTVYISTLEVLEHKQNSLKKHRDATNEINDRFNKTTMSQDPFEFPQQVLEISDMIKTLNESPINHITTFTSPDQIPPLYPFLTKNQRPEKLQFFTKFTTLDQNPLKTLEISDDLTINDLGFHFQFKKSDFVFENIILGCSYDPLYFKKYNLVLPEGEMESVCDNCGKVLEVVDGNSVLKYSVCGKDYVLTVPFKWRCS
jgi:hypothetical protein